MEVSLDTGLHPVMPTEQGAGIVKAVTDNKEEQEQEEDMELEEEGLEEATMVEIAGRAILLEVATVTVTVEEGATVDMVALPAVVEALELVLELLRTEILPTDQTIVPL